MWWTPQSFWKEKRRRCYIKGRTYSQRCLMQGQRWSGEARQIVQVGVIMTRYDLLAAWMFGRRTHIALACHLLTARLLCLAHPCVRHQTVRPRCSKEH